MPPAHRKLHTFYRQKKRRVGCQTGQIRHLKKRRVLSSYFCPAIRRARQRESTTSIRPCGVFTLPFRFFSRPPSRRPRVSFHWEIESHLALAVAEPLKRTLYSSSFLGRSSYPLVFQTQRPLHINQDMHSADKVLPVMSDFR